jgi:hypothetical protein
MIEMYEGRPGNYKSYSIVKRALEYLGHGGIVAGNVSWKVDGVRAYVLRNFRWRLGDDQFFPLSMAQTREFWKHIPEGSAERPTLVLLDECGRMWNARDWATVARECLDFFALSRHEHTDIILSDQHADNIDRQFRRLVSQYHVLRNFKEATRGLFPFPLVCEVILEGDRKTVADRRYFLPSVDVFTCYDSYCKSARRFERVVAKSDADKGGRVKMSMKKLYVGLVCLMICGGAWAAWKIHHWRDSVIPGYKEKRTSGSSKADVSERVSLSATSQEPAQEPDAESVRSVELCEYVRGAILPGKGFMRKGDRVVVLGPDGTAWERGRYDRRGLLCTASSERGAVISLPSGGECAVVL